MNYIEIGEKRYWLHNVQYQTVQRMQKRKTDPKRVEAMCKRTSRVVTGLDQDQPPTDQTVKVAAARAGMIGTSLGAESQLPPTPTSDLKVTGDDEKGDGDEKIETE